MRTRVVIAGAGPAGCATGILLCRAGFEVTIVDRGMRPPLIVGESLIPAVVAQLRRLGLEERVAAIGMRKPGAAIAIEGALDWSLAFDDKDSAWPTYAYNVPRKEFDRVFQEAAGEAGCSFVTGRVTVAPDGGGVKLVEPANLPFDFFVDASGRARLVAGACGIGAQRGGRSDFALFSHFDRAVLPHGGSIHMSVFDHGWTWRIPLPGRVSVGFVAPAEFLKSIGGSNREQFSWLVRNVPILRESLDGARQIEEVYRYQNYQLVSERLVGSNWAMVGDAAGFVDPVFSSGVSLSLDGAFLLAEALALGGGEALARYESEYRRRVDMWQSLVDTFYDGRFLTMIKHGRWLAENLPELLTRLDADRRVAGMISGLGIIEQEKSDDFYHLLEISQTPFKTAASA